MRNVGDRHGFRLEINFLIGNTRKVKSEPVPNGAFLSTQCLIASDIARCCKEGIFIFLPFLDFSRLNSSRSIGDAGLNEVIEE
jgi:hypothetical protein